MNFGDFLGSPMVKTSPSKARGVCLTPGQFLHALWPKYQNKKQKKYCNIINKDFKNNLHQKIFKKDYEISLRIL